MFLMQQHIIPITNIRRLQLSIFLRQIDLLSQLNYKRLSLRDSREIKWNVVYFYRSRAGKILMRRHDLGNPVKDPIIQ